MKWLLLLFVLFPGILFGQKRQRAIVDSIKAAGSDIHRVSAIIGNNPGNDVERIAVSDSSGYVTIVVRVHVTEPNDIASLSPYPAVKMKTRAIVTFIAATATVPPAPRLVLEPDIINLLTPIAYIKFRTTGIPLAKMDTVALPPMPDIEPEMDVLPLIAVALYRMDVIDVGRVEATTVPPLTIVDLEAIPEMPLIGPLAFDVAYLLVDKVDTTVLPAFEDNSVSLADMHLSAEGYDLLEKLEGFSPQLYSLKDGGFTIGFGFFVPYGEGAKWSKGVTMVEAERIMRQKVPAYEDQVKQYINIPLTQEEFDALTMLAYNLGGFSKATSIVNDINTNSGYDKLQKDWMRFVHSKAPGVMNGLMNRRKDELLVRYEANYQPDRKLQVFKSKR